MIKKILILTIAILIAEYSQGHKAETIPTENSSLDTNAALKQLPVISGLSSASGCAGSLLLIYGTGLTGATSVTIGGTSATININTDTTITVTIGTGTTGTVTVITPGGSATSTQTFTVYPIPVANVPANISACNYGMVAATNFTSTPAGGSFMWTNSNTNIGLASSGTGNISSFVAHNTGNSPIYATITVFTTLNGCSGTLSTFSITVYPTPIMTPMQNISACAGDLVPYNPCGSIPAGSTFTWTNSNSNFGIGAYGPGCPDAFLAQNQTSSPISGTITITPVYNGCVGSSGSYTITINPRPAFVIASVSNNPICNGTATGLFSSAFSYKYVEEFETWLPWGFTNQDNSYHGNYWNTSMNSHTGNRSMYYHYNATYAANAWAITPYQPLTAGKTYTISFWYKVGSAATPEKLKVTVGNQHYAQAQTTILWNNNGGTSLTDTTWTHATATYTPSITGYYYFGFNCYSDANMNNLYVDDITITAPTTVTPTYTWSSIPSGFTSSDQNPGWVFPDTNTQYMVIAHNPYGCPDTANVSVSVINCGSNDISGKTRYAGKAIAGNPVPAMPVYNSTIYDIDNVIVILKNFPSGTELARDTSDAAGNFLFPSVPVGTYMLSYDKYTTDTMQTGNDINVIDVALVKYLVGSDTTVDPSRNFSTLYKKAANVDNNAFLNAIDFARMKAKILSPYNPARNFPKGNWVAIDTIISTTNSDLNIILKTICYGDFNASSTKYLDSLTNWNMAKTTSRNIISTADDYVTTVNPEYFEVPLKISHDINDFSALGLELNYQANNYKLISATMPKAANKCQSLRINPTLDEIIADDNDLLVTDENGVIRVVYATTNHFDVASDEQILVLGFRSLNEIKPGALEFNLSGTGTIANKYGEEDDDAYLTMPKIFVQGNEAEAGFDFTGYPNPFNGEASLSYTIPENGTVTLNVYNALGERICEPVNEMQMSGQHTVTFSSKDLPAGMYTFRLEFNGADESKCFVIKMIH